jgi:hypothetical protein
VEILNKITMKTIGAQPKPRSVTEKKDLCHIFGTAIGFREGSTTYGVFRKFEGNFEAVDLQSGEVFKSKWLLLPEIVEALLTEQLTNLGAVGGRMKTADDKGTEGTPSETPVDFAFSIGVKPIFEKDGKTIVDKGQGYEYTVRPMMESKQADSLAHLREVSSKARQPALPAPEKVPAQASETAQDKAPGMHGKRR